MAAPEDYPLAHPSLRPVLAKAQYPSRQWDDVPGLRALVLTAEPPVPNVRY
jgi:hypothetical protein